MTVVCKKYDIEILVKELGRNTTSDITSTSIACTESFDKILKTHTNFLNSMVLRMCEEDRNLPYFYWTLKLRKTPFKHRFFAGSSKCIMIPSLYNTVKGMLWLM